jgi:hypothetical protein
MTSRRRWQGGLVAAVCLLVGAVLLGAVGVVGAAAVSGHSFLAAMVGPVEPTPAHFTRDLQPGSYLIYQLTGTSHRIGPLTTSFDSGVTINVGAVVILGPDGRLVPLSPPTFTQTVDRGDEHFTGAVEFVVHDPGVYRIDIETPGQQVIVAASLGNMFGRARAWLAIVVLAMLLGTAGLVVLVVSLVSGRRRPATPGGPAPGWFPDPTGSARLRWWNGSQWTENISG